MIDGGGLWEVAMIRADVAVPQRDMSGGVAPDVDFEDDQPLLFGEFRTKRLLDVAPVGPKVAVMNFRISATR